MAAHLLQGTGPLPSQERGACGPVSSLSTTAGAMGGSWGRNKAGGSRSGLPGMPTAYPTRPADSQPEAREGTPRPWEGGGRKVGLGAGRERRSPQGRPYCPPRMQCCWR